MVEPIAIIGIGCRFPQAKDPESFWQLLCNGEDAITEVPKERWDIDQFYDPEPGKPGKMSTRWGGFLEQVDLFDPGFFGISPREVERTDPQQRLVLEVAWEAIENAGLAPDSLGGSQTGVFMGIGNYDYCRLLAQDITRVNAYDGTGNTLSIAANRLSYTLNLRGPSVVVETACSSSLVAVHFACQSLHNGESNLCIVGGVSLMLSPEPFITYSHARMMAADGRCKTFDARADGYVRGEGCGVVVLKRLSDALKDGDNIQAVIRGTAINQDGQSNGLTAPNGPSQQAVIRKALQNAGVSPARISYVETHGTGTSLGDPIEFKSLKAVLMQERQPDQTCWLGSVKTSIGHLEAAAGIASIIKVVLSLQHQKIPPHLHLQQLNPYISLTGTTFAIPTDLQGWTTSTESRLAGISAFGFGGTNCHVVLEEAHPDFSLPILDTKSSSNDKNSQLSDRPLHLLTLSAKNDKALQELVESYRNFLTAHPDVSLADICFTVNTGRSHFDYRVAIVADSIEQLRDRLKTSIVGQKTDAPPNSPLYLGGQGKSGKKRSKIAFLFTGQGSQYVGMGHQLYETQLIFRAAIDRCDRILRPYLEKPLLEVLYPAGAGEKRAEGAGGAGGAKGQGRLGDKEAILATSHQPPATHQPPITNYPLPITNYPLNETAYTQPALFALEYALFQLWQSWGIEPAVVIGHSVGEYAAACVAGVFSLEDGLKLIATRSRLMQALPQDGKMVAVFASESQVQAAIQSETNLPIGIAATNGSHVVISGQREAVETVVATLQTQGIKTKKLNVSHAFHSALMEPMLAEFERVATQVKYSSPRIKLVSNVTGEIATDAIATPEYWCSHVRQPVKFAQGMKTLHRQGYEVFVEIGPKPTLLGMGRDCLPDGVGVWLPSLHPNQDDWQQILQSLATLYVRGGSVNWTDFDRDYSRRRIPLPTYPFQRQRYWAELPANGAPLSSSLKKGVEGISFSNLLSQGNIQQLVQQLATTGKLSHDELKLLPKLLDLLREPQPAATKEAIADWFYEIEWQHLETLDRKNEFHQPGSWLIFADKSDIGKSLCNQLQEQGHQCILVRAKDKYQIEERTWEIDPTNAADYDRLLQDASATLKHPLQGIVHLWSLEAAADVTSSLEQAQAVSVGSVLYLLQALVRRNQSLPRLWLTTRGAVPVGRSPVAVAQAPLWGLGKVIALEHPELWGGAIDLSPEVVGDDATNLLAAIQNSQNDDRYAFRDGQWYIARLVRKSLPESPQVTLRADSTYLITGSLGALGLKVAQWMVTRGARNLILVGRREPSSQAREAIALMEQAGAKTLVMQADVSQEADVLKVLENGGSMPPLRGVIHAAGVLDDGILLQQNWERFTRVMAPKVKGTWNLHVLTQNLPLDFFVVFSSAASILGSPGQCNYAAANAFMDSLMHYRRSLELPGLSINWGPWGDAGMAANLSNRDRTRFGVSEIAPEQGLQALEQVLGQSLTQISVLPFDWSVFAKQLSPGKQLSLLSQLITDTSLQADVKSSVLHCELQRLQTASTSDRQQFLTAYLQNKVAQVLGLPNSALNIQQPLHEMGLDSLMAVELTSLIRAELQVELPIRALIEDPSIADIADLLIEQLTPKNFQVDVRVNVKADNLDLNAEAVLDPTICPDRAQLDSIGEPASILLTGATGFLGAFLLQELLDRTQADIYCLVRAADLESANVRLQNNLSSYNLWSDRYNSRIMPILGDLSQPQLGLSTAQFDQLAHQIDTIYHNGALLNYIYPYSRFKPINVLGTQEVLRLACQTKIKPVHHISSVAVFESSAYYGKRVTESDPIECSEGIYLGYSQSKWVSEKLIQIAGDRGLPITIYRPPLVSGHSRTGVWNTDGFLCRMIQGCIQMGSIMTDLDLMLDLSPVDYNSKAIVYLSRKPESFGKVFHLQNPHLLHWSKLVDFICSFGYPMERVSYQEWQERLSHERENPLYPLLPFFRHKWSDTQLTYIELNEQDKRPQIGFEQTLAALAGSAIVCPPQDAKLLATYFSYFIRSGFLNTPPSKLVIASSSKGVGSRE